MSYETSCNHYQNNSSTRYSNCIVLHSSRFLHPSELQRLRLHVHSFIGHRVGGRFFFESQSLLVLSADNDGAPSCTGCAFPRRRLSIKEKKVHSKTPRLPIEEAMLPRCLEWATPPTRSSVPFERSSSMDTRPRLGRCLDTVRLSDTISRPPILGGAGGSRRESSYSTLAEYELSEATEGDRRIRTRRVRGAEEGTKGRKKRKARRRKKREKSEGYKTASNKTRSISEREMALAKAGKNSPRAARPRHVPIV